jgi:hypothetical protein
MAWNFISLNNAYFLHLLLPQVSITNLENGSEATIDFVLNLYPTNSLDSCGVRKNLHHGPDILPILSVFSFVPESCLFVPHQLWKKVNVEAIR